MAAETNQDLLRQVRELEQRLGEAEETLQALRSGAVDAIVASGPDGDRVYPLKGGDEAYRILLENMAEGAVTLARDGLILFANEQFADMLGMPLQRVFGSYIQDFVAAEDALMLSALLATSYRAKAEARLKRSAGLLPVQIAAGTLVLDSGECVCLVVTDLSEQKRNQEMQASVRLARSILEQAAVALLVVDRNGRVIQASRAAGEMAGQPVLLRELDDVFRLRDKADNKDYRLAEILTRVRTNGRMAAVQAVARLADGRTLDVLLSASLLTGDESEFLGCIVLLSDVSSLHTAEERLRKSEEQLRLTMNSASDIGIFTLDSEGFVTSWSTGATRVEGYSEEEIIGRHVSIFYSPEERHSGAAEALLREAAEKGISHQSGWRVRKNGVRWWADVTVNVLHDADGSLHGFSRFVRDLSDRRDAAAERSRLMGELEEKNRELAAIQANAPMLLLVVNDELRVERGNDFAERFAGRAVEDMTGQQPGAAIGCVNWSPEPSGCGVGASCNQCKFCETVVDTLRSGRHNSNVEVWLPVSIAGVIQERCLLLSTAPLQHGQGRKTLVCAQDITELKKAELELVRQSATLQQQAELINLSADAIITMSPDRYVNAWNSGATEMYGWTATEAAGKSTASILGITPTALAEVDEILGREGRWDGELIHVRNNGQELTVHSRQILSRDDAGVPTGILQINRDITERKQSERRIVDLNHDLDRQLAELQKASAEKDLLLREVQHRVKNNLQVISSMLSLEARRLEKGPALKILQNNRDRIRSIALIHEKFCYSKDLAHIDFGEYVSSLVRYFMSSYACDENAIQLSVDVDVELEMDDAIPCGLILQELLSNSMKYAFPDGSGEISIEFQRVRGELRLRYHDSGAGLPAGIDIHNPESLGLQLVGDLAAQLRGRMEYRNASGATFEMSFKSALERTKVSE